MSVRDRQIVEEDALLMRHLTLESQREFLMRRGFSPSHPYISGEVPIHPELQGRLPFHHVPSRYISFYLKIMGYCENEPAHFFKIGHAKT